MLISSRDLYRNTYLHESADSCRNLYCCTGPLPPRITKRSQFRKTVTAQSHSSEDFGLVRAIQDAVERSPLSSP